VSINLRIIHESLDIIRKLGIRLETENFRNGKIKKLATHLCKNLRSVLQNSKTQKFEISDI